MMYIDAVKTYYGKIQGKKNQSNELSHFLLPCRLPHLSSSLYGAKDPLACGDFAAEISVQTCLLSSQNRISGVIIGVVILSINGLKAVVWTSTGVLF